MKYLTPAKVAERLHRNPELVRRWIREGRLRAEKVGRSWAVLERELERFQRSEPERRDR
jgi:excisionase family DNA binding protein